MKCHRGKRGILNDVMITPSKTLLDTMKSPTQVISLTSGFQYLVNANTNISIKVHFSWEAVDFSRLLPYAYMQKLIRGEANVRGEQRNRKKR